MGVAVVSTVVLAMLAAACWVYTDAREQAQRGNPVVMSVNSFELSTPAAWFVCCLLMGELFLPLYLDSRNPAG